MVYPTWLNTVALCQIFGTELMTHKPRRREWLWSLWHMKLLEEGAYVTLPFQHQQQQSIWGVIGATKAAQSEKDKLDWQQSLVTQGGIKQHFEMIPLSPEIL